MGRFETGRVLKATASPDGEACALAPEPLVGSAAKMNRLPDHDKHLLVLYSGDTRIAPTRDFDPYISNGTRFINFTVDEEHVSAVLDANKDDLRVYEVDPSHPEPLLV